ncbi:adenylate cyclase [Oceanibacterium hippocampi]|uniref:adenylate cyclase n=1 Tax=Oceanibacterium hippocampi TaxID=745714 RepID=A0A1Y5SJA9_9PROT|nr:adenylate cyclase [Oceanibacterium hippocampi]SLN39155.1 Adenylate cyclase [Oceanibacterium hippocampi]
MFDTLVRLFGGDPSRETPISRGVLKPFTLRFLDKTLEARYWEDQRDGDLFWSRVVFAFLFGINCLFAIVDVLTVSEGLGTVLWLRLGLLNALAIFCFLLTYRPFFRRRHEWLLHLTAISHTLVYLAMNRVADVGEGTSFGFSLAVLGIYVLLPMDLIYSVSIGLQCTAIFLGVSWFGETLPPEVLIGLTSQVAIANVIGLFARYRAERFRRLDYINMRGIEAERGRYRALLERILPVPIAARLQAGERQIGDRFEAVTILFADLVGFTRQMAATPDAVIDMLNRVFDAFDAAVEQCGLEKIKTIGDAYMVGSGIPVPRADHLEAAAGLALELRRIAEGFTWPSGEPVVLRIGIHTGPLMAGVIGDKRFLYDVWGDTVNVASRLERMAEPGRIQVSDAVHDGLNGDFRLESRGEIEVKGRGMMPAWYLEAAG